MALRRINLSTVDQPAAAHVDQRLTWLWRRTLTMVA